MKSKHYDYDSLGYLNPWKAYKKGLIPPGLAVAYKEKWGYDPLKEGRLFYWLDMIRYQMWYVFWGSVLTLFFVPSIAHDTHHELTTYDWNMIRYATIGFFVSLLILSTTYKRYKESREKVWDVQRRVEWFMKRFRDLFTGAPLTSFKTKESLAQAVSVMIVSAVKAALVSGVAFGDTESLRLVLINLIEHANAVGLERNWETYIGDVVKTLDTYECFNWQI